MCDFGWTNPENNPHIHQVLNNPDSGYEIRTDLSFVRTLCSDSSQERYRRRKNEVKSVICCKWRGLALTHIEFLTNFGSEAELVVYVGASPAVHIPLLLSLFPHLHFVLFDTIPLQIGENERISFRKEPFTLSTAEEFSRTATLLISDISPSAVGTDALSVQEELDIQLKWLCFMQPKQSLLRFRLPWTPGSTSYLAGDLFLPLCASATSTETRIVPRVNISSYGYQWETVEYDHKKYEEQMFYFNTVQRVALYPHDLSFLLDHCYDCKAEVEILFAYLRGTQPCADVALVAELSKRITDTLLPFISCSASQLESPEELVESVRTLPQDRKRSRFFLDHSPKRICSVIDDPYGFSETVDDSFPIHETCALPLTSPITSLCTPSTIDSVSPVARQAPTQSKPQSQFILLWSKNKKRWYYFNQETRESSWEPPKVDGWELCKSRKTGAWYYFNPQTAETTYNPPIP